MIAAKLGLFDTLTPMASIVTASFLTVYTLPRHGSFGIFVLLWWLTSVMISIQDRIFRQQDAWSENDLGGLVVLIGLPTLMIGVLFAWFQLRPAFRLFVLQKMPLWCMFAIHLYRLDGLSIILPLMNGSVPKYLGLQMILLDVLIGGSSIPLAWITYQKGVAALESGWQRDFLWLWNSIGLYDLVSAYLVVVLNFSQIGGEVLCDPPLAVVGFHPIPLIVLFQAPLAILTHLVMLLSMDVILQKQGSSLPLHVRLKRIRTKS